jgi:hypothetical protein
MVQSNSDVFIALGVVLSTFMGRFGLMFTLVNIAWRAWQTFNDVTEESYGKMSSLNQMFARAGGYMEAFGEILSTINGDTYELSESLVMKLKSIGAFEGVLKMGNSLLTIYKVLEKIFTVGSKVANMFDGNLGWAIVYTVLAARVIQTILVFTRFLEIMRVTKTLFSALSMSTFPFKAGLMQVTVAIAALGLAWKLATYLFDNWGALNFVQKLGGVLGVLGLLTIAIYAIGTAFGIAALTEAAFLAPLILIVAAISAAILGIQELYNWIDSKNTPGQQKVIDSNRDNFYSNPDAIGSVIPRNFRNSMQGQTELSTLRNSPTYAPINQSNSDMSSSQDINLYLELDGERVYQNQIKYHEREGARSERG